MSISMKELLGSNDWDDLDEVVKNNLNTLLCQINKVRDAYGKPMTVNSGYRSPEHNATIPGAAKASAHCRGLAVDIKDIDNTFWKWVLDNLELMRDLGFFMEDRRWTPTWVHLGLSIPKSGNRVFIPSATRAISPDLWDGIYDKSFDMKD